MRLLNTGSLELRFFFPSSVPDYVILSHRWGPEECSFEDVTRSPLADLNHPARMKQGFLKLQGACDLASRDGYSWIWIDTCCIDKSSSAELQEAINSMWKYYAESNICYAYIVDIPDSKAGWDEGFRKSEWFTRGWTLQELIAPICVEFYANDWAPIGTKNERYKEISEITQIDPTVLVGTEDIDLFSAAQKLSWAAHRKVTREEDEAYSLLGIFEVNIPLLYGEGRERAFNRLQEAIFNSTADHTLFLFRYSSHRRGQPLLADSPTRFCDRTECTVCSASEIQAKQCLPSSTPYTDIIASGRWETQAHEQIMTTVTPLRNEMSTTLPLLTYQEVSDQLMFLGDVPRPKVITHVAVLNHTLRRYATGALCLLLRRGEGLEAFLRIQGYPAVLARLGPLEYKLQKTKLLICPGPSNITQLCIVGTTFSVKSKTFTIQEWSSKNCTTHRVESVDGDLTELKVYFRETRNATQSPQISCQIVALALKFSVKLIMIENIWSINEVAAMGDTTLPHKSTVLFHSSHVVDRCSVSLSSGAKFSVGLRRLPAACRAFQDRIVREYKYQIVVESL